ncbi:MAG: hypothetical protein ABIH08_05390 [Candidatus Omnitrophota bacterium]
MKSYIFLTLEGFTFQPNSESANPDIENLQVIGFAKGKNPKEAFKNLVKENNYLLETDFNEIFSYKLAEDFEKNKEYHYLVNAN